MPRGYAMRAIHVSGWSVNAERALHKGIDKGVAMAAFIAFVWIAFLVAWFVAYW